MGGALLGAAILVGLFGVCAALFELAGRWS